jgi:ArsR family transcriptional regulator, lead/cadmium/zinc/bismuth-responsive transcriptional repressor
MDDKWERAMLASKVDKIDRRVDKMEKKLTEMDILLNTMPQKTMQIAIGSADGFLPDHLEKTKRAVKMLGNATASDVAKVTNRHRAIESSYLCQLERIGILTGERIGRIKWYGIVNACDSVEQCIQTVQQ